MDRDFSKSSGWLMRSCFSTTAFRPLPLLRPDPAARLQHAPSLDANLSPHRSSTSRMSNEPCEISEADADFSFPSPFSSSTCRQSGSSMHSKSASDCFSPARDDQNVREAASPGTSPSSRWLSMRSLEASLSHGSSSWPASTETRSPRRSFDFTKRITSEEATQKGERAHVQRVPSWSQHLASAGGETAVLSAESWMVDLSQLLLGEKFACGTYSRLYRGMYKDSPVAVKVIRLPDEVAMASRVEQLFTQEVTTLSCLQHRNVIKFIAACKKPPVLCVISEYLAGGSLRAFLHRRQGCPLPIRQVVRFALDIASGMEYLHMKRVIHRDLKSANLVLSEDECVKIVDFGVSCFESHCDYRADDPGTYRWMAPEMLSRTPYTRKVDVYSFGIVLWELLTTRLPYEELGAVQAAFSVLHKNVRPPIPSDCPALLKDLMRHCWSADPEERPQFWEILRTLTTFDQFLNGPGQDAPERHRYLPGWLRSRRD